MVNRSDNSWLTKAREAALRLDAAKIGEREKVLNELASGREVNSVRRLLKAASLHDRWTAAQKVASDRLLAAPQTIIEGLSRWAEFDEEGAWRGFLDWEQNRMTVQALNAIVTEKRASAGLTDGKVAEKHFRELIEPRILEIIKAEIQGEFDFSTPKHLGRSFGSPSVDFACVAVPVLPGPSSISIAVVIVGPYRGASMYGRKLSDWMQKALSLAWIYHTVILLVPDRQHAQGYRTWLKAFTRHSTNRADRPPDIRIIEI
jgi:hypothetical protein